MRAVYGLIHLLYREHVEHDSHTYRGDNAGCEVSHEELCYGHQQRDYYEEHERNAHDPREELVVDDDREQLYQKRRHREYVPHEVIRAVCVHVSGIKVVVETRVQVDKQRDCTCSENGIHGEKHPRYPLKAAIVPEEIFHVEVKAQDYGENEEVVQKFRGPDPRPVSGVVHNAVQVIEPARGKVRRCRQLEEDNAELTRAIEVAHEDRQESNRHAYSLQKEHQTSLICAAEIQEPVHEVIIPSK